MKPKVPENKLALSVKEAAHVASFGRSTLYEALASGELKAVKLGRRTLVLVNELRRFLEALPPAPPVDDAAVNQFCDALGISRTSFYELVKQNKIKTVVIAGRRLVPDSEARRLLAEAA
jgi:excisionase family DNA binding protein